MSKPDPNGLMPETLAMNERRRLTPHLAVTEVGRMGKLVFTRTSDGRVEFHNEDGTIVERKHPEVVQKLLR